MTCIPAPRFLARAITLSATLLLAACATQPLVLDDPRDYADPAARLVNQRTHQFQHTMADVVGAVLGAGLTLDWLHEHDGVPWRMFACLEEGPDRLFRFADRPWLPLSYSLSATRR